MSHARAKCTQVIMKEYVGRGRTYRNNYRLRNIFEMHINGLPPTSLTKSSCVHATHVTHANDTDGEVVHSCEVEGSELFVKLYESFNLSRHARCPVW